MSDENHVALTGYDRLSESEMHTKIEAFRESLSRRRSIRKFSSDPVPQEIIETAIRAAGSAPSGANHQPWHFVAISDQQTKAKIRAAAEEEEREFYQRRAPQDWLDGLAPLGTDEHKPFLEIAPWLIAVFAQRSIETAAGEKKKNYYVTESVGLATGMLITALHSVGLGTLTHTPSPMEFLTQICDRPKTERPFVLLVVGYPADDCQVPTKAMIKKELSEISTFI